LPFVGLRFTIRGLERIEAGGSCQASTTDSEGPKIQLLRDGRQPIGGRTYSAVHKRGVSSAFECWYQVTSILSILSSSIRDWRELIHPMNRCCLFGASKGMLVDFGQTFLNPESGKLQSQGLILK
jgi:hypothetical protein